MKDRAAIGFSAEFTIAEQQDKFEVNIKFLFVIFASFLNTNFALIRSLFFFCYSLKKMMVVGTAGPSMNMFVMA